MNWVWLFFIPFLVLADWVDDTNRYGEALRQTLDPGNRLISPLASRISLLMAYLGADGETESLLRSQLCITKDVLPPQLPTQSLEMICTAWLDARFSITPTFEEAVSSGFEASVCKTPFIQEGKARESINHFFQEKSGGVIASIFGEQEIDPLSQFFLISSLSFQAPWVSPFDPKKTTKALFYGKEGSRSVEMMQTQETLLYSENETMQAVALPFSHTHRIALVVVLPKGNAELATPDYKQMKETNVAISLPKFHMKQQVDLKEALSKMGGEALFHKGANFTGITTGVPMHITRAMTQVDLAIGEFGAGGAKAPPCAKKTTQRPQAAMHVNRPFLLQVVDLDTGLQMIVGEICAL